jgi:peroxiredoxin
MPATLSDAFLAVADSDGTLESRLAAYRGHVRRIRPDVDAAYDRLVARLNATLRDDLGPVVGERMPNFALPDQAGNLVSLDALRAAGPVVVSFNRGHWCPYCRLELRALAATATEVHALRASIVSITPEVASFTQKLAAEQKLPFPVLTDLDFGYALALGLVFSIGPEIEKIYRDYGIALDRYQGNESRFLPVAATFIVGSDGCVAARFVDFEFRRRMEPRTILDTLRGLKR